MMFITVVLISGFGCAREPMRDTVQANVTTTVHITEEDSLVSVYYDTYGKEFIFSTALLPYLLDEKTLYRLESGVPVVFIDDISTYVPAQHMEQFMAGYVGLRSVSSDKQILMLTQDLGIDGPGIQIPIWKLDIEKKTLEPLTYINTVYGGMIGIGGVQSPSGMQYVGTKEVDEWMCDMIYVYDLLQDSVVEHRVLMQPGESLCSWRGVYNRAELTWIDEHTISYAIYNTTIQNKEELFAHGIDLPRIETRTLSIK